jgi:methylmalonyl-CoA mutase
MSEIKTDLKVAPPEEPPLPESLVLAGGFRTPTRDEWRGLVTEVLAKRGPAPADPEVALTSTTPEGIAVAPLYTRTDAPAPSGLPGFAPFVRGREVRPGTSWDVRARQAHPDPAVANEEVLEDLEHGVTSLWLVLGDGGIPVDGLATALDEVLLDLAPVVLDAGASYAAAAEAFLGLASAKGVTPSGNLGADPVAVLARTGVEVSSAAAVELAAKASGGLRAMTVDALPYHEAGGTDADEVGLSLAHGVAHLRLLVDGGLSASQAADQLEFRYAATADQFLTIAKLRAARQVWSRVLEASGVPAAGRGQLQHAVTSWTMTTVRDPWTTLLRDTLATFAAGVGGADAVTVLPFDAPIGLPGVLSRRMARNTSAILVEESHVARVTDPAGGSWYVESLTADLAAAAWKVFQDTEAAGGIVSGLKDGSVAARLAVSAEAARVRLAKRKDALTGVSEFPQLDEKPLDRPAAPAMPGGGLPRVRRAQAHEALRDASDAYLASTGGRPTVLAVTFGPLKAHSARLDYVRNLLAPGGIVTDVAAADALPGSSPLVAVLVAADDVEPDAVQATIADLRAKGATTVLRAGRSKLEWPGVDGFVYIGIDALAVLQQVQDQLGVSS